MFKKIKKLFVTRKYSKAVRNYIKHINLEDSYYYFLLVAKYSQQLRELEGDD